MQDRGSPSCQVTPSAPVSRPPACGIPLPIGPSMRCRSPSSRLKRARVNWKLPPSTDLARRMGSAVLPGKEGAGVPSHRSDRREAQMNLLPSGATQGELGASAVINPGLPAQYVVVVVGCHQRGVTRAFGHGPQRRSTILPAFYPHPASRG
ncbi:hypothetical protein E2C01_056811 [Portunus trituberculatus]|uniref:Uncharacterized protein n=1 Tax=Portunus trituberculatus TaxID=210409 RepID=A0A5B7GRC6_PORTR|nr:hypothetical protein [Portunus trituberculatus]